MDNIDAMLGLGIDDVDQTQALADALRGRKKAADMFALSTVGNIAAAAKDEQQSVDAGARQGGMLRKALQERQLDKQQKELDREVAVDELGIRQDRLGFDKERAGVEDQQYNRSQQRLEADAVPVDYVDDTGQYRPVKFVWDEESKQIVPKDPTTGEILDISTWSKRDDPNSGTLGTSVGANGLPLSGKLHNLQEVMAPDGGGVIQIGQNKLGVWSERGSAEAVDPATYQAALSEEQINAGVAKLEDDLKDRRDIGNKLNKYREVYSPYTKEGATPAQYGDIPGSGRFSGKKGVIGWLGRAKESMLEGDGEDAAGREFSVVQSIINQKVREGAGLSQTVMEILNQGREMGEELFTDPRVRQSYIDDLSAALGTDMNAYESSVHPQIMARWNEGRELTGASNPFKFNSKKMEFPTSPEELVQIQQKRQAKLTKEAVVIEDRRAQIAARVAELEAQR